MAAAESGTCESGAVSSAAAAKIARIVDDYARLASVSAAEIGRKRQAVRAKCQERLWMAAAWRDYQLEQAQKAFEADLKALEKEHQVCNREERERRGEVTLPNQWLFGCHGTLFPCLCVWRPFLLESAPVRSSLRVSRIPCCRSCRRNGSGCNRQKRVLH
jgi:hypothetical protein